MTPSSALVLFSGGQDSTTCVAWALARYARVETVGFDYGQRHRVELDQRAPILAALRALSADADARLGADHVVDLRVLGELSDTALTRESAITLGGSGLPSTFVPGRNLMFLTMAAAIAYRRDIDVLVGGMCETDYSGYPDCRDATMKSLEATLALGMDRTIGIVTPLMWLDKAATWQLAQDLGGDALVDVIRTQSHTCYLGERTPMHDWGAGCAKCPACLLRADGYARWRAAVS